MVQYFSAPFIKRFSTPSATYAISEKLLPRRKSAVKYVSSFEDLVEKEHVTRAVASNMIYGGGLKIYTTMDSKVQAAIDEAYITDEAVVAKLFNEIAPEFENRNGGYTQIYRLGPRRGDGAEMAMIKLVGIKTEAEKLAEADAKKSKAKKETAASDAE